MNWLKRLIAKVTPEPQTEWIIHDTVLPNFPKMSQVDSPTIWRIIDNNTSLCKACNGVKPSTLIRKKLRVTYKIDVKLGSECYPVHSPITVIVKLLNKENNEL